MVLRIYKCLLQDSIRGDEAYFEPIPSFRLLSSIIGIIAQFLKKCQRTTHTVIYLQQSFRHRHYQPGGLGYQKAQQGFDQLTQT